MVKKPALDQQGSQLCESKPSVLLGLHMEKTIKQEFPTISKELVLFYFICRAR